jgi:uncharacterized repeat protein (TIGR04138 family)
MHGETDNPMERVIRKDGRYPMEAFALLQEGLAAAVRDKYGEEAEAETEPGQRHVTGRELCMGTRKVLLERYGMLARAVLAKWNIRATIDFGNMVYLLIQHGLMHKTDEDSLEDFRDVFDFQKDLTIHDDLEMKE